MKNTNLLIFDLDGTLVNAYPAIIRSFNYTMKKLGYPLQDILTIRGAVGWGDENLLRPFLKQKDLKKALSIYRAHHKDSLLQGSSLFPQVRKVLRSFKKKVYKLAVASNRPTKFSLILIRHLNLGIYFAFLLCADKIKKGKPDPAILNAIMQKFSAEPKNTLYIGDMTIDAQAGRRAHVRTIIVTTGSSTRKEIKREKPYRIISRITDLLKIL